MLRLILEAETQEELDRLILHLASRVPSPPPPAPKPPRPARLRKRTPHHWTDAQALHGVARSFETGSISIASAETGIPESTLSHIRIGRAYPHLQTKIARMLAAYNQNQKALP